MILELIRVHQNCSQGTKDAIPALFSWPTDNQPQTEQWLGAYPLGDSPAPDGSTLLEYLAQDPNQLDRVSVTTFGRWLPFLVRALSVASLLSLQAHPTRQQACDDHAHESLMGIPLGALECSFKDGRPKPETIAILTPFEALVGFRDPLLMAQLFEALEAGDALTSVVGPLRGRTSSPALQEVFLDVPSLDDRHHLVDEVLGAAVNHLGAPDEFGVFARTTIETDEYFPSDPGIPAVLLLNRFSLEPGQALVLPSDVIYSYLRSTYIETMVNSDNVLRGGLTGKRIDVDVLLYVVDFTPGPGDVLLPSGSDNTYVYPTSLEEFEL